MEIGQEPLKNHRWETFALEVVKLDNQTTAMLVAYPARHKWSRRTVWNESSKLAAKPEVNTRIAYLKAQAAKAAVVTRERILNEYAKLAFTNLPDIVYYNGKATLTITDFEKLTAAQRACIKEIKFKRDDDEVEHVELKFYDKQKALDALAKHDGLFAADNTHEVTGSIETKVDVSGLNEEEKQSLGSLLRKSIGS